MKTRGDIVPFAIKVATTNSRQGGAGLAGVGKETWLVNILDDKQQLWHLLHILSSLAECFYFREVFCF